MEKSPQKEPFTVRVRVIAESSAIIAAGLIGTMAGIVWGIGALIGDIQIGQLPGEQSRNNPVRQTDIKPTSTNQYSVDQSPINQRPIDQIPVNQTPVNQTRGEQPQNSISEWQFPMASCGDQPPIDASINHPVYVYRVKVDHTANNLQAVQSQLCGDAFPRSDGYIQIASFTNEDKAARFKELISNQFQGCTVERFPYKGS